MFKLKKLSLAILPFIAFQSFAYEKTEDFKYGVYGNIQYDFSDYENSELESEEKMYNSNAAFYVGSLINENTFAHLDFGVFNGIDLMANSYGDEFNFTLNKAYIDYQYSSAISVEIGRMYTPVGFYNENPVDKDNLIDNANFLSRTTDAFNVRFKEQIEDIEVNVNAFAGTRFDDSHLKAQYGFNVLFGNQDIGKFNFGFSTYQVDGLEHDPSYFDGGYLYDKNNIKFIANFKNVKDSEDEEYNMTQTKAGYQMNKLMPYVLFNDVDFNENESRIASGSYYGTGVDFDIHKFITLSVEYNHFDSDLDNDEELFNASLSFKI